MDVFTSISLNYLPKAKILAASVKKFHPDWKLHLLINDSLKGNLNSKITFDKKLFDNVVWIKDLKIENLKSWIFKHNIVELCTAVKGPFLKQLVDKGAHKIMYIDPDIVIFNDLSELDRLLDDYAILLTPHLIDYSQEQKSIIDNEIFGTMRHGTFNLGFLAINAEREDGKKFANWWAKRLLDFCFADYEKGLFTDQKWCDLIPSYFDNFHIIRNPGYNAASWNLDTRQISFSAEGKLMVNEKWPLRFYHFTGYDSGVGSEVIENLTRDGSNQVVKELWDWYYKELIDNGQAEYGKLDCAYDYFNNGVKITALMRTLYRTRADLQTYYPDPYTTDRTDGGFLNWMRYQSPKEKEEISTENDSSNDLISIQAMVYREMIQTEKNIAQEEYVPITNEKFSSNQTLVKPLAFYLPQFHPIPENDLWWGKGFTEWSNVTRAVPQFPGHYQPHLPGDLGFYDLRLKEVQYRQIEIAKQYGIHGFAFYYYWFAGKRLLEKPINQFLESQDMDFPFCVIWANENWTRRWDGLENDILIEQVHTPETDIAFIQEITPFLRDRRYIRINGRPIIIVYRVDLLPNPTETAERWRIYCIKNQLGDPYLMAAQTFGFEDPRPTGFDAAMQFPPHNHHLVEDFMINPEIKFSNPDFSHYVWSYPKIVEYKENEPEDAPYPLYKGIFPIWDSEPRKPGKGAIIAYSTPELYKRWLKVIAQWTITNHPPEERFVFINAWNEWAEGAHLEPDQRYGYAYLQATMDVLRGLEDGKH